ncbi:hypothetical protein [Sphingobium yanoikuyae]|uniref:hypothetical protein n=1 Tax=Sphingobium yanoikuyae TaxID=13690 RepID=UPI000262C59F|nr:hypothetical protein [Sphingobium yanoikuyae]
MSRHDLPPKADQPHVVRATVGWDRPLQTFFAQVFFRTEDEPEEGEALIWFGTEPGELLSPEAAIEIVAPHAIVPAALADQLADDMRATAGTEDGSHQALAKRSLFGSIH